MTATLLQPGNSSNSKRKQQSTNNNILHNPVILCILLTECAERVAYFGFRAILVLYFAQGLKFSDSASIALCSATAGAAYFSPLLGALLADGLWGRYKTILYFGWIYALGLGILSAAAFSVHRQQQEEADNSKNQDIMVDPQQQLGFERYLSFAGLFLACLGTGGIKPCVSAFGADQVTLEEECDDDGSKVESHHKLHQEEGTATACTMETTAAATASSTVARREERIRAFFASFYFCINVGALASFALIPVVRAHWGFGAAFFIPFVCMCFAMVVFWSQRHRYKHSHRSKSTATRTGQIVQESTTLSLWTTFRACGSILYERFWNNRLVMKAAFCLRLGQHAHDGHGHGHQLVPTSSSEDDESAEDGNDDGGGGDMDMKPVDYAVRHSQQQQKDRVYKDAAQALHVLPILMMFPVFWMLYDQQGSVWTLQANRMALHGLEPEQLNVLNPIGILMFIPLFDQIIYPFLENTGWNIAPLRRMQWGMLLMSVSFCLSGLLEGYIQQQPPSSVHVAWQIPQITIITAAEILLSVTGLEFSYAQAPQNMQAFMLAIYLFMTAVGDFFGAILYSSAFSNLNLITVMNICALLMLVNLGLFSLVARRWKPFRSFHGGNDHHHQEYEPEDEQQAERRSSLELGSIRVVREEDHGD
jgi:dipeptide/tripeptide permease